MTRDLFKSKTIVVVTLSGLLFCCSEGSQMDPSVWQDAETDSSSDSFADSDIERSETFEDADLTEADSESVWHDSDLDDGDPDVWDSDIPEADSDDPDGDIPFDADVDEDMGPFPSSLPVPTGSCPDFESGTIRFEPDSISPRDVRIWISDDAFELDGPLVFYWYGTGSNPGEVDVGLGDPVIDDIISQGGIVAAPYHDPAAGMFPWFLTMGGGLAAPQDDLILADEILGCAIETVGVDVRRIHSLGFSAGGLHTTQMSYLRSSYVASVATYSGGLIALIPVPPSEDPTNLFPAMILYGGLWDLMFISFMDTSRNYWNDLNDNGQFAAICDHGDGHVIPTDARGSVWVFFQEHPFGTDPSPYETGLPGSFPDYCLLSL